MAGDTVILSGTFTNQQIAPGVSGTATAPITYTSQGGPATAVLQGAGAVLDNRRFITIRGLTIQNMTVGWPNAVSLRGGSDNLIEGNEILNIGDAPANAGDSIVICQGGSRNRILSNTIRFGGQPSTWGSPWKSRHP